MNRKNACFFLFLVLMAGWIDRLATGTFLVASPTATPSFGDEIYTFAMKDRDQTRATVEAPPLAALNEAPFSVPLAAPNVIVLEKALPRRIVSGANARYLFMSLQR
jgi:hypothetical protein